MPKPSARFVIALAALLGAIAVALGAMGGHAMQRVLNVDQLGTWETATRYLAWHVLAALAIGLSGRRTFLVPALVLLLGGVLFAGSLYLWLLTAVRPLVFVTPLGGGVMILGWLWLFAKAAFSADADPKTAASEAP